MFHPFLCYGGPIPICVGTFGEVNKTVDNRDAMIAKLCSKDTSRAVDLPSSNELISRSYGHHQESVPPGALGVQFMKANARLKLERLHLVGSAPAPAEESRPLAQAAGPPGPFECSIRSFVTGVLSPLFALVLSVK
jgi:hypothetical protein